MADFRDDDFDDDDTGDSSRLRGRLEAFIPNVIRRTVSTGDRAKQLTEDAIRAAIGDLRLPKEAINYLVDLADNTKREVVRVAAREFREFLESARFNEELAKLLTQLSFEIRTEIRFIPNDQALKPSVTTHARVKTEHSDEPLRSAVTDSLSDAMRSSATEFAEMFIGRVFRHGDTGSHAATTTPPGPQEPAPEPPAKKQRASGRRSARKPQD